jgi:murein hydrolase activator
VRRSALLLAAVLGAGAALAEPARTPEELERIEAEIAREKEAAERAQAGRDAARAEAQRLGAEAAKAAAALRAAEAALAALEREILELGGRELALAGRLETRRAEMAPLLVALQRLSRDPPPALAVTPDDAAAAARSAILLAGLTETLAAKARALEADLAGLAEVRASLSSRRQDAIARAETAREAGAALETAIAARTEAVARLEADLGAANERLAALDADAEDLRDLIAWLEEGPDASPASDPQAAPVSAGSRAIPLVRGALDWPASGEAIARFGEDDGAGGTHKGVTLAVKGNALVTSPSDGEIVFAGPFGPYRALLILDCGDGYFVLIDGVATPSVVPGQFVLTGEPLGRAGGGPARLYVELRRGREPLDPAVWFRPQNGQS